MDEFSFIILTIAIVVIIFLIVGRIISKKNKEKIILFSQEKFSEKLNDLDTIVKGVSKKDKKEVQETIIEEVEDEHSSVYKKSEKKPVATKSQDQKPDLKNSIISKEILDKKKSL